MDNLTTAFDAWNKSGKKDIAPAIAAADTVIRTALKSYVGRDDPIAYSHAKVLTSRAFKSFDPTRHTQLRTHLLTQLQPLRRFAAERRFVVKVPEQVQYDMTRFRETMTDLSDELGRPPSDSEMADKTGFSMSRIGSLKRFTVPVSESTKANETEGREIVVTPKRDPMEDWMDYIYHDLGPVDQKIFEWRTGYNKSTIRGVVEIAKDLGISAAAVTQRANKISSMLEQRFTSGNSAL